MSTKQVDVNGTEYRIIITEQVIGNVNNLKIWLTDKSEPRLHAILIKLVF